MSRTSTPSTNTVPLGGSWRRARRLNKGRLSRSRWTDDGDCRPGGQHRGNVAQDDLVPIRKGEVTELEATGDRVCRVRERRRGFPVGDAGLAVQDLEKPLPRRHAALQQVRDPSERDHRPGQHHEVGVEGDQFTDRHPSRHHIPAAEPQHEERADAHQEAHAREVHRLNTNQSFVAPDVLLVGESEALDLVWFLAVRPHDAHA